MKLKPWKITAIVLASLIGLFILIVLGYVIYVSCQYSRIPDNEEYLTENNQSAVVELDCDYNAVTYNIGFGAYEQAFDFFMDYGQFKEEYGGKAVKGKRGKAISKENVIKNTNGSIASVGKDSIGVDFDFMLLQEVDTKADRSYKVNQYEAFKKAYNMGSLYIPNFHTAYLMYPFNDPHGASEAGIATFSKYNIKDNIRRQYPISTGFSKFFDLDRCFVVTRMPIKGSDKEFVLINSHMSAYDEGGVYRAAQLKMLNGVMSAEREKGNYVVVGGDFNHDIANSKDVYESWQVTPDETVGGWLYQLYDGVNVVNKDNATHSDIAKNFRFATTLGDSQNPDVKIPTCRCAEMPYERDEATGVVKNYQAVLDGFIVSDNIEIVRVKNIDTDFKYSDHNPVQLTFRLKK